MDEKGHESMWLSPNERVSLRVALGYYLGHHVREHSADMEQLLIRLTNIDYPKEGT